MKTTDLPEMTGTGWRHGRWNIGVGFLALAAFMAYGFVLIYLRDFHADRDAWIAQYSTGKHFEARLAHVHGNLFAFLNVVLGYLLARLPLAPTTSRAISWLGLAGMLMPVGILAEVYLGAPPFFVLIGGAAMLVAVAWFGMAVLMVKAEHASEGTTS